MFPFKTLVLAGLFAVALGPHVNACPAHNHMQSVKAPAAEETVATTSQPVSKPAKEGQSADVAAADKASNPAVN